MKTIISIISLMTFLAVNSYSQNSEVNTLLEKPDIRKDIFNIILNSHNYMTEFVQAMHGNQHAMMMVNGNNCWKQNSPGRKQKIDAHLR